MRPLLVTLFALLLTSVISGQPYGFLSWSVEDGLPQSQVTAIVEDDRGYLWVGTNGGGVARFDGSRFVVFGVAEGLSDNFVRALSVSPDGVLYALTQRGIARLRAGRFIDQSIEGRQGLFSNVSGGLNQSVEFVAGAGLTVTLGGRAYRLHSTGKDSWRAEALPERPTVTGELRLEMRNGRRLLGTRSRGLFVLNKDGSPAAHYTEEAGDLPHNHILSLYEDSQLRYWVGTSGGGLVRMIPSGLSHYGVQEGLGGNRVYALHAARDGKLWIGASKQGIQYRENGRFARPEISDPTKGNKITSIAEDVAGRIYFATDGRGVAVLDTSGVRSLSRREGLADDFVLKVLPAGDSGVWAATYARGLTHLVFTGADDSLAVESYRGLHELSLASVISGPGGSLLLGSNRGTVEQWWPPTDSLAPDNRVFQLPAGRTTAMTLRLGTQLWAAVLGRGLFYTDLRMPEPRFFPVPPGIGGLSTNIFQLAVDPTGKSIWIGTERGLSRLYLNADGRPDYLRRYGREEGFLGGETTRDGVTVDSLGRLWFGTLNGLVRFVENADGADLPPPATWLEGVSLFYESVDSSDYRSSGGVPSFAAADNHFQFRYVAVDLTYPGRIRYRYRLRGGRGGWSPLTDERSVRFAGLDAGRYTFEVQASTDGGKTFGSPADYTFQLRAPLVRSGWFLGLTTLLLAGLIVWVSYALYRRVQRREAALREELATRNRLLELEQKARQLQMNPHFIFNALNGIRGLVDGEHDAEAREQITRFATLMRGILNNSRQEVISLKEEVDVLRRYIEMERFCQNFPIDYTIHLPDEVDPEEISLPPMLLQPFVENAILHGLAGKKEGGTIAIHFILRGRRMQCLVEDSGVGVSTRRKRQAGKTSTHKSVAVEVTRERIESTGGSLRIDDRQGGGTVVEVVVPVEVW